MSYNFKYGLFEAYGIEIEYMIVMRETLLPAPLAHLLLTDSSGTVQNSITLGNITLSNELAAHVIELKTSIPTPDLKSAAEDFQSAIRLLNERLANYDAMIAPGGMHPFMRPKQHSGLWEYGDKEIYQWYDRVFDCRTHGWLNLQSCHINLPFKNEEEFARLHDAVIVVLPLLPALSAASPYLEGRNHKHLDTRLIVYAENQKKRPLIAGDIIPERITDAETYTQQILRPAYESIKNLDPDNIVESDWLNSRGAIARFDRGSVEIRLLDTQEAPAFDLAICSLVIQLLKTLVQLDSETLANLALAFTPKQRKLHLLSAARDGRNALLADRGAAAAILPPQSPSPKTLGDFWKAFYHSLPANAIPEALHAPLELLLKKGNLSERILRAYGERPETTELKELLRALASNAQQGTAYAPPSALSKN